MLIKFSKEQLDSRWDSIPEILREAMSSEANSDTVWKTAEGEHLPEEKIMTASKLVGYVLMGFIHPEDLARELHDNLGIDKRIAASIAEPINKKIFQPLREELEIVYSPAVSGVELPATEESVRTESPKPVLMDSISSVPKFFQTGQIPKPAAPMPTPPAPTPKPATKPVSALNQFSVSRPVPPATPDATVSAAPFMLHMESKAQPLSPSKSGFKIGLSEEQFGKMEQKWTAPPKPAQIETSFVYGEPSRTIPKPVAPKPISPSRPVGFSEQGKGELSARVIHYNEMKTPVVPTLKDKEILPPQIMPNRISMPAPSQVNLPIIKSAPFPSVPLAISKTETPAPAAKVAMPMPKPPAPEKLNVPKPPQK